MASLTLPHLLRGAMLLSLLLPTETKLAIVRVFANENEVLDMNPIFLQWNTVPPCGSQPSVPIDLLLVYSQSFQDNAAASQAADEVVTSVTSGTAAWSQCFASARSFDAQLSAEDDVYDSRGYAARRDWANGPNSVFMFVMRSFNDGTFGSYHAFYFMEFDAVPVRPNWLDVLVQEAYDPGMAVRGSRFRGDTWDSFLPQLSADVLFHLNGNAIYNLTHPWLVSMTQTLQQELNAGTLSTAFDVRMAQLTLAEYAKDLEQAPYKADSILIGNYAQTLLNSSFEVPEFIRHASMSNIFENLDESKITLGVLGTSDLSTFMASLSSLHPFRKVIIARDTKNIPATQTVTSTGGDVKVSSFTLASHWVSAKCEIADKVTTEFVMFTDSLHILASPIYILVDSSGHPLLPYTPSDGSYCTRSSECMSELEEAEQLFGVKLNYHHSTHETVFNTAQFKRYCAAYDLAVSDLPSYQDCGVVNGITADGFIAWLISMSSSEPFNYVPKSKQRFGNRGWGLLTAAHAIDTRTCSVYTQEEAALVTGNITTCPQIIEDPLRCQSTAGCTWRPLFGRCVNTPTQVSFDFFRRPSMTTTTTQTATTLSTTTITTTVMTTTITATTVTFTVKVACTAGLPQGFETSSCANLISGQSCTVSCMPPLEGSSQYFCNQDGVFEGVEPTCASRSCAFAEEIPTLYESAACLDIVAGGFCFVTCPAGQQGLESLYTCGSDWVLRGNLPECQRITCDVGSLPQSSGANFTDCLTNSAGLPVGVGETCQIACNYGFTGGSQTMNCLESGNFQGNAVTCARTQCQKTWSESAILLNCREGTSDTTNAEHGDVCVTSCANGYVGASTELKCVNGEFEGNLPTCVPATCTWQAFALVSNVDNTDCNGKQLDQTCQLVCENGFTAVGSPTVTCQSNGFYSQPQLTCQPLSCGDLSGVAGFPSTSVGHNCDNSIFSDTCSAFCLDGYQISGSEPQLQCSGGTTNAGFTQVDGTALQSPTCVPQPCTGGFPTMRGATHNCTGVVTGESCTVTAEPGYQATPSSTVLECQADGFITGTMPVVEPATCADGSFTTGIGSTCQNKVVGAECWAYCLKNYVGDAKRYVCQVADTGLPELSAASSEIACAYNGTRRLESEGEGAEDGDDAAGESSRRVVASCDSNSVQAFGLSSAQFTHSCASLAHDEVCISHCSFGWELTSSPSVLVCAAGTLEGSPLPTCQPVPCNFTWPGPKVDHDCDGKATLETCTGQCKTGYTGATTTIQCEASGNFQQNDPTCEPVKCETQLAAQYTSDCINITLGRTCSVDCAEGYDLNGGLSRLSCGSDGNFVGLLPNCTAVQCANTVPTDPAFDKAMCDNLVYGQSCSVTCNPGYAQNTSTLTCNSRGALTGTLPLCIPEPCDGSHLNRPELLNTCDNILYGQNCSTFCARGFEASTGSGLEQLSCMMSTGNKVELVGVLPSCTARPCTDGLPLASDRATNNCSALTYQERCVEQCVEGYTGSTPNFLCGSDGSAQRDTNSVCRPEICNTQGLSALSHNCENVSYGESCYAYCPPGYVSDQPAVRLQCLGSNSTEPAISEEAQQVTFRGILPQCVAAECTYNLPWGEQYVHNCSNAVTGQHCLISCAVGWFGGMEIWSCQATGQMSGSYPSCQTTTYTTTRTITTTPPEATVVKATGSYVVQWTRQNATEENPIAELAVEQGIYGLLNATDLDLTLLSLAAVVDETNASSSWVDPLDALVPDRRLSDKEGRRLDLDEAVSILFNLELPTFNVTALTDKLQLIFQSDHIPVIQAALQNTGLQSLSNVRILAFTMDVAMGDQLRNITVSFTVEQVTDPVGYPIWALVLLFGLFLGLCLVCIVNALLQRRRNKPPPTESNTVGVNQVSTEEPAEDAFEAAPAESEVFDIDKMSPTSVRIEVYEEKQPEPPRTNETNETNETSEVHDVRETLKDSGVLSEGVTDSADPELMQEVDL